jgi:hypothetical protein
VRTRSVTVVLSERQKEILERVARSRLAPQQLVERCEIALMSAEGRENADQAAKLDVDRQRVRRWRHRWAEAHDALSVAENQGATDKDLEKLVFAVLADEQRSGAPPRFGPEQVASIIALACESPADSGLPVSHWTPPELAREAIKRGIVETISPRHVDRFLARRTSGRTKANTG